jgi:hypothetical protein
MTKDIAIKKINKELGLKLNNLNTNWSNINRNGIWSMEPNLERKEKKLFLLLNNNISMKLHVFEIPANNVIYEKLYVRNDRSVFRLLFNVDDHNFIETLKHINFNKFHKASINY